MSIRILHRPAPTESNWRLRGNCLAVDPDLMHPDARDRKGQAKAKAICRNCPVERECIDDSVRTGDFGGVRGGLTGDQRREQVKRAERLKNSPPMGCTECGLLRLQHAADDHGYQTPDMATVLARAAALKSATEQREDYLYQINRCEHRTEWRQAAGLCGGCGKDNFAEITEEAA